MAKRVFETLLKQHRVIVLDRQAIRPRCYQLKLLSPANHQRRRHKHRKIRDKIVKFKSSLTVPLSPSHYFVFRDGTCLWGFALSDSWLATIKNSSCASELPELNKSLKLNVTGLSNWWNTLWNIASRFTCHLLCFIDWICHLNTMTSFDEESKNNCHGNIIKNFVFLYSLHVLEWFTNSNLITLMRLLIFLFRSKQNRGEVVEASWSDYNKLEDFLINRICF